MVAKKFSGTTKGPANHPLPRGNYVKLNAKHVAAQKALEAYLRIGRHRTRQVGVRNALFEGAAASAESPVTGSSNIIGTSISEKQSRGSLTGRPCIRVYVQSKIPDESSIESTFLVPKRVPDVNDIETDVVEVGVIRQWAVNDGNFPRPVPCGVGIAAAFTNSAGTREVGTLGARCVVNNQWAILSNNHVLALNDQLPLGTYIVQDGLGVTPTDVIGQLSNKVPLSESSPNTVDAAIALSGSQYVAGTFSYTLNPTPITATPYQSVRKDGYMTGTTSGQIVALNANVDITAADGRVFPFEGMIEIQGVGGMPFSAGGDSGSLVVSLPDFRPVAMIVGGSGQLTFASPIQAVMDALSIERFG